MLGVFLKTEENQSRGAKKPACFRKHTVALKNTRSEERT